MLLVNHAHQTAPTTFLTWSPFWRLHGSVTVSYPCNNSLQSCSVACRACIVHCIYHALLGVHITSITWGHISVQYRTHQDLLPVQAALCPAQSMERLMYVAAFAVSGYSGTGQRTVKPFNPLLGETFELVYPEKGYRALVEKARHSMLRRHVARHFLSFIANRKPASVQCLTQVHRLNIR